MIPNTSGSGRCERALAISAAANLGARRRAQHGIKRPRVRLLLVAAGMRACRAWLGVAPVLAIACGGPDDSTPTIASPRPPETRAVDSVATRGEDVHVGRARYSHRAPTSPLDLGGLAPPDEDATPFATCSADADCVSVPKVGCCQNGWKAAVNKDEVGAYEASFHCPVTGPICIQILVVDRRKPQCNFESRRCELADHERTRCGAQPACTGETSCRLTAAAHPPECM